MSLVVKTVGALLFVLMMFLFILSLLLPSCHALSLTTSDDEVEIVKTQNVSLKCAFDRLENSDIKEILVLRILKLKEDGTGWRPIVEIRDTDDLPRLMGEEDIFVTGQTEKQINGQKSEVEQFLKVTWAVAESKTVGKYRCDMMGWDEEHDPVSMKSQPVEIKERSDMTSLQLYNMLLETETKLNSKMDTKISDVKNDIGSLRETNFIIISWFQQYWPEGTYGLHSPSSGCPANVGVTWHTGYRRHGTESTSRNIDKVSDGNHFGSIMSRSGTNNLIFQNFCMVVSRSVGPLWPKGSYCIARRESENVPEGFKCGQIYWYDEVDSPANSLSGHYPLGDYTTYYTRINYCCRSDMKATTPMYLPTEKPFYLYRYGGTCQQIHGMNVKEEFILFDTDDRNLNVATAPHPDAVITPDIKLVLCYYSKK